MRSEKIRLLIFSLFLAVLIVWGFIYQPLKAVSHPTETPRATGSSSEPVRVAK